MARLLIVDDDQDLTETLRDVFEFQKHLVALADNGTEALRLLSGEQFDLILLDWQLPDGNGLDVCREYRQTGGTARILMLTGMRDAASKDAGKAAGADDFLTKPFTVDQLLEKVQANLA